MPVDTQEKRMAATGVGRPWMRGKLPGANDQEWRIASGNAYGGNVIATYLIVPPLYLVAQQVHVAGSVAEDVFMAGQVAQQVHVAGSVAEEVGK